MTHLAVTLANHPPETAMLSVGLSIEQTTNMLHQHALVSVSPLTSDANADAQRGGHLSGSATRSFSLLQQVMCHTREGIVVMDARGQVLEVNSAFCRISELEATKVIGHHITRINSDLYRRRYYRQIWQHLRRQDQWQGEMQYYNRNGVLVTHWLMLNLVRDNQQQISHIIGILDDISQLKDSAQRLSYLAHHDALTGCANRAFLQSWFNKVTAASCEQLGLLFIDLDRFKPINDSFGHEVGDQVLIALAKRLQNLAAANELVARLGGDEFVMVYLGPFTESDLEVRAQKVLAALGKPINLGNYVLSLGASIGMSVYPEHGQDLDSLLRYADIAMYHAKRYYSSRLCLFERKFMIKIERQQRLVKECSQALEQDALFLEYQPVFTANGERLQSLAVLLRWQHSEFGVVYPDQILPAMKAAGLGYALSEWVFVAVARQLSEWRAQYQWQGRVSINLSGIELEQLKASQLLLKLDQLAVSPSQFSLELNCDCQRGSGTALSATAASLRTAGMHIYLNKLGLGQINFNQLGQLPLDGIKLDPKLWQAADTVWVESVIGALVLLANARELEVIACGIEHEHQWRQAQALGCDQVQGPLLSVPLKSNELGDPTLLAPFILNSRLSLAPLVDAN